MERQGFESPLLIGGATTSPAHTSVKIDPNYHGPVIYVKDASRAVGVAQTLLASDDRQVFIDRVASEHGDRRRRHAGKQVAGPQLSLLEARGNRVAIDWAGYQPPRPQQLGVITLEDYPLAELVPFIDWMPFFNAWEFAGRFPDILDDPVVGESARPLYEDAQAMLARIVDEGWLKARGVFGFFPAAAVDDDIVLYRDESRSETIETLHHLRQQRSKRADLANDCLADFIAPAASGIPDYLGAFAVTAGIGIDEHVAAFEAAHDDYSAILLKALADRLAEAFAECLHARVRREFWGYAAEESLGNEQLIAESYQGIRPAPGYPACPDHTEKGALWRLLDVPATAQIDLTESYAMLPTAAVSGWYFAHPAAHYFAVGKLGRDQVEDYARRKGWTFAEAERWLSPYLGYTADAA